MSKFQGFNEPRQNWSKLPHQLIDALPEIETIGEMKVIVYTLRHTWGYQDDYKKITLDEFQYGRKQKNGERIDSGTGLTRPTIIDGIKRAIKHGFLFEHTDSTDPARVKKFYSLTEGGLKVFTPDVKSFYPRGKEVLPRTEKETLETNKRNILAADAANEISVQKEKSDPPSVLGNGETPNTLEQPPQAKSPTNGTPPVSGNNEFADHFGPNPRQAEIDNHKREGLSKDELILQALGAGVPQPIRALVAQMRDSQWKVNDGDIEKGIAIFAHVTGFPLPTTKRERKQWETGVRQHLEDEMFRGRLTKLYTAGWEKLEPQVRDGTLTITHPMALTTTMKGIVLAKQPANGQVNVNEVLAYLKKNNIVEIRSVGDESATYFWVETGEVVENIPKKYIEMVYQV